MTVTSLTRNFPDLRKLISIARWGVYYLNSLFFFLLIPVFKRKVLGYSFEQIRSDFQIFGRLGLKSFGIKGEILNPHNVDLKKGYILTANHRSWLDQVLLVAYFPRMIHFLANVKYWKLPFMHTILENNESIPVDQNGLSDKAQRRLDLSLQKNETVLFYIEGTRGSGRTLLPFKKGAFKTSMKHDKEILPIYILGTEQCLSKHKSLLDIRSGEVTIVVGKPVSFDEEYFEVQFKTFEEHYNFVHNKLYDEFEYYLTMKAANKSTWKLPSLNLV